MAERDNMENQRETLYIIVKAGSSIWAALLCAIIALAVLDLPIRIYIDGIFVLSVLAVSTLFYRLLRMNGNNNARLSRICMLLVIPIFISSIFNPFVLIDNPFTAQQFASRSQKNFLYRGTITYYRRIGFILYAPEQSEYCEFSADPNYLSMDCNKIYVNSTFMGPGATYENENTQIDLRGKDIDELILGNDSAAEHFELTRDLLHYSGSDGTEINRPLTDAEYEHLRSGAERMQLVEEQTNEKTDNAPLKYRLSVKIDNDDASYYSYVDGQGLYESMYDFLTGD